MLPPTDHSRLKAASPEAASSKFRGQAGVLKGGGDDGELEAAVGVESAPAGLPHQRVRAAADGTGSRHSV